MDTPHEDQAVDAVVGRLAEKYPDVPRSEIERIVHEEHHALDGNPVRDYVPVLVEHQVRERLEAGEPA